MERKRFDVIGAAVSFALSFAAFAGVLLAVRAIAPDTPLARALAAGAVFTVPALVGYVSVRVVYALRGKLSVALPKVFSVGVALALVVCFIAGFAGQYAYSLRTFELRETVEGQESSDIVMMIDDSGSLVPYYTALRAVANAFVDGLPNDSSMAAGLFARKIGDFVDMAAMDSAGKQAIKTMLADENRFAGGSDLDLALETAYKAFAGQKDSKRPRAIVLLTDGRDQIDSDIIDTLKSEKIRLFSVRIKGSDGAGTSALISAVKKTGGSDIEISNSFSSDSGDLDEFMKQFEEIAGSVKSSKQTEFADVMMVYDEESPELAGVLIRFAALFLLALCVQLLYLRRMSVVAVLLDFLLAAAVCAAITYVPTFGWELGEGLCALAAAAGIYTWYVLLTQEGGYDSPYRQLAQTPAPAYNAYPQPGNANPQQPYYGAPQGNPGFSPAPSAQPFGQQGNAQQPFYGAPQGDPGFSQTSSAQPFGQQGNAQQPFYGAQPQNGQRYQ